jgi:hypothetical protein
VKVQPEKKAIFYFETLAFFQPKISPPSLARTSFFKKLLLHRRPMDLSHVFNGDKKKMEALLENSARMIGTVLSLKSPSGPPYKPMSHLLKEEVECYPTLEKLDELERIKTASTFVADTEKLARTLRLMAYRFPETDVNLLAYAKKHRGMYESWGFRKKKGGTVHKFVVGEIAQRASENIANMTYEWLFRLDHLMCTAFDDFGDADEGRDSVDTEMQSLCTFLSERIASYATGYGQELSIQALESRACAELVRNQTRSESTARDTLVALSTLHRISKYGSSNHEGASLISKSMHHVRFLMDTIPPELSDQGIEQINVKLLREACRPDLNAELRNSLVEHWRSQHGRFAEVAAYNAMEALKKWMAAKKVPFIHVLEQYSQKHVGNTSAHIMPPLPFMFSQRWWVLSAPQKCRNGLDFMGRRVVRLTSLVWQLFGHGEIRRGIVSAASLDDVAVTAFIAARNVGKLLDLKRDALAPGCRLMNICMQITDFHGDLADEMTAILADVSLFSFEDLDTIFSSRSPIAPHIMTRFSRITRSQMIYAVPERYFAVAHDCMRIVLPIIKARRAMLAKPPTWVPNPVVEVLRTIQKVREWTPLQGTRTVHHKANKTISTRTPLR